MLLSRQGECRLKNSTAGKRGSEIKSRDRPHPDFHVLMLV
jgi:hypothetical protein